jgi:hypothetical protein
MIYLEHTPITVFKACIFLVVRNMSYKANSDLFLIFLVVITY